MKTIQDLYNEIMASKELKEQFIEAAKAGKQEAFLKEHGCEAAPEQVAAFLKAKSEEDAPLSLDELENSAGGKCTESDREIAISIGLLGVGCVFKVIHSAAQGHVGKDENEDGLLCHKN